MELLLWEVMLKVLEHVHQGTYLQIFNLGNRACDGLIAHDLNIDINPDYLPFTDEEMGLTAVNKLSEEPAPFIIKVRNDGKLFIDRAFNDYHESTSLVIIVDLSGRIVSSTSIKAEQTSIELGLPGKGLYFVIIHSGSFTFTKKIIN